MYDIYVLITMRFSKMFFLLTYFSYFKTLYFCAVIQPVIK